ncbi:MAG: hypothetical protein K1X87_08710 [Dehalococcoidia bacterium]|nr:hypothetical protein [Dehalococcoidia bacterium]HRC63032.1 hypothetical protein [Dehalococcoidia bacterium]
MATYRLTTRVGACVHCGTATVQSCAGCERFVCRDCEWQHHPTPSEHQ